MPAVCQVHAYDRIARFERGLIDGQVRVDPRMDLNVGVVCPEERLRPIDRELLKLVGNLGAAMVASAWISLASLVIENGAQRGVDGGGRRAFRRDQAQRRTLTFPLAVDQSGDGRVDDSERLVPE